MLTRVLALTALLIAPTAFIASAAAPKVIDLWPGAAPGDKGDIGAEKDTSEPGKGLVAGKPIIRLGNVSKPSITIMKPAPEKDTGAAVIICPGGAYNILAWDLEGTEVAEMFNKLGVTGIVLKYRVPKRADRENYAAPLQDAQRAVGLVRAQAKELGLDPNRIGVLGFSAGGHLAATLAAHPDRTYPQIDSADSASCRPDFLLLIYPAYLVVKEQNDKLADSVVPSAASPKTFIVIAEDDPVRVEGPLAYYAELKKHKIPAELHIYPTGGHGYGLRRTEQMVTTWPDRAADWLRSNNLLTKTK
jgi:acetyl esterase/lipase